MREFGKAVQMLFLVFCVALFGLGIVWNLFYGMIAEETLETIGTVQEESTESVPRIEKDIEIDTDILEERLAVLRMERNRSWQQLLDDLDMLQFTEKEIYLKQQAELQFRERRLELLLQAKGISHSLVLLEQEQANVIVPEEVLAEQYEKIYELVQRNTDYIPTQIVLIPLYIRE